MCTGKLKVPTVYWYGGGEGCNFLRVWGGVGVLGGEGRWRVQGIVGSFGLGEGSGGGIEDI